MTELPGRNAGKGIIILLFKAVSSDTAFFILKEKYILIRNSMCNFE
jgi:hypothetical protein